MAFDIQRGRDHGIPGYVKYRDLCGLSPVRSFDDLRKLFTNSGVADSMAKLYRTVDDIDLFIAGELMGCRWVEILRILRIPRILS